MSLRFRAQLDCLSAEAIDELIQHVAIRPIMPVDAPDTLKTVHDLSLGRVWFDHLLLDEVLARAGTDRSAICDTRAEHRFPHFHAKLTDALWQLADNIGMDVGMAYGNPRPDFGNHYFLSLAENSCLHLTHQSLLSSHRIGKLSERQIRALKDRMFSEFIERERGVTPTIGLAGSPEALEPASEAGQQSEICAAEEEAPALTPALSLKSASALPSRPRG